MDSLYGIDLDGNLDMEKDGDDDKDEDDKEEDDENQKKEAEKEDKNVDDGKKPWIIGQGEMLNLLADNGYTMVDDQPIVLSEQGQEMRKHSPQEQPPAPAQWPQIPEPSP